MQIQYNEMIILGRSLSNFVSEQQLILLNFFAANFALNRFTFIDFSGISASLSLQARSSSCIRRIGPRFLESSFHALTRV